jgi:exopolysaccharide biosynthesis polyprenyl glycosylphosphotransferase
MLSPGSADTPGVSADSLDASGIDRAPEIAPDARQPLAAVPAFAPDAVQTRPLRALLNGPAARVRWQRRYSLALVGIDATLLFAGTTAAAVLRWGAPAGSMKVGGLDYYAIAAIMAAVWLLLLGSTHSYDARYLGIGSEEFRRVADAAIRVTALVAFVTFVGKLPLSRGFVAMALPIGLTSTLAGRYAARNALHRRRRRAQCLHRVLVVGTPSAASNLAEGLSRSAYTGYRVAGTWSPSPSDFPDAGRSGGDRTRVLDVIGRTGADTVAVASSGFSATALRDLAWQLEGSGVDLLVSPALTDVAGPRIHMRPVDGLPLLHVEEPQLDGGKQFLKSAFDRAAAVVLLVVTAPFLIGAAVAILATSHGPVLFRQQRSGRGGLPFMIYKFRTMHDGADARFAAIVAARAEENRGGMFVKVRDDDRITSVGRWLRRFSLDELPQLLNVVRGQMSLVGPRPLPVSVEQDEVDVSRRLLVRPGMTGLWQVSGRSDLTWDESVRLDLYYVENWSPAFDLMILWKTARAVLRGSGAY